MKNFSAQYVYTNSSVPLKRPVITTTDDGEIISIEETGGNLTEKHSTTFYNGVIVPGFVNCHCHLELSHMHGKTTGGKGLAGFIEEVRNRRDPDISTVIQAIKQADSEMYNEGVTVCADVCNTSLSFATKEESPVRYISLLEVFGINSAGANKRMNEIMTVASLAVEKKLKFFIVPHSVYSVSEELFSLIREQTAENQVSSIHFLESDAERIFLRSHSGPIMDSYKNFNILPSSIHSVTDHTSAILDKMAPEGSLLLIHNTFITREEIRILKRRKDLYWCLCPNSNIFIEDSMPPVGLLVEEDCEIVLGTDSKGSNKNLDILNEMRTIQDHFPTIPFGMLVKWATLNGAKALGEDSWAGSIEPGKKPGLVLIDNFDFINHRLLKESRSLRLI